jgi:hypothetical protein
VGHALFFRIKEGQPRYYGAQLLISVVQDVDFYSEQN